MKTLFSVSFLMSALIVLVSGCKKDNATMSTNPGTTTTPKNDINLSTSNTLGWYLTDKQGQALYLFANEADGTNSCGGPVKVYGLPLRLI
jgi:predicted lipoprotein with Yx(FWY)xxD motif